MKIFQQRFIVASFVAFALLTSAASADVLRLKDGERVEGTFIAGDSRSLRFMTEDGEATRYSINDVQAVIFGEDNSPKAKSAASARSTTRQLPADTSIVVRMIDAVDSDKHEPGETFQAHLEEPLEIEGQIAVPKNSPVTVQLTHVKQSGRFRGEEEIALRLHSIQVGGRTYPVNTSFAELASEGKGKQTAKVVGGAAVIGTLIGAVAGGKKGAVIGAATGAGAGATVQVLRGKNVKVPSETLLAFTLTEALAIQ